jgi:hypothetical protein
LGLDEVLVVGKSIGSADSGRLLVRLRGEIIGPNVWHPHLNKPKALLAHSLPMCTDTISYSHETMLHVTLSRVYGRESHTQSRL